ncbi:hypothetical protein IP81_05280 [Novosphingobium sp. AAP83]|uniref:hypothetical protein n=1 Tax=Novosphingobium sp. AAP83 TaxID=1523425 RepID=UPI0006B8A575|nr:hypothetical protein [Novosphingobium sp. AAP83]KPF92623.1 hypothetical protein IP81_05280 [Novosphingobium sp. AAP83]
MPNTTVTDATPHEQVIYSARTGITRADARDFRRERIEDVVKAFKANVLAADNKAIAKLETDTRTITYKQLQEVYKIGWVIRLNSVDASEFKIVLADNGLGNLVKNLNSKNFWKALVTLLYGNVQEVETEDGKSIVCTPNRSAEKYANVLRYLGEKGVDKDKVVETIQNFNDSEFGGGLLGIEMRDRKRNPGSTSKPASVPTNLSCSQQSKRDKLIARGEDAGLNGDVFAAAKSVPETLRYGQAVFKVVDGKMVIVGYTDWGRAKYENYVIRRGRKFQKEDDKSQANEDARQAKLDADALNVITSDGTQDQVAALIQAGVPKDAVQRAIANAIAAIPVPADFNDFASPDPM